MQSQTKILFLWLLIAVRAFFDGIFVILKNLLLFFIPSSWRHKSVEGKNILITGGGGAIGRSIAIKLSNKGARIISWDINEKANDETADIIRKNGGECTSYRVDISSKENIEETSEIVKDAFGFIDIIINNAGIAGSGEIVPYLPNQDQMTKSFQINVFSHLWIINAFLPEMMKENRGHIVSTASLAGRFPIHFLEYSMTKSAACALMDSLRQQFDLAGCKGIKTTLLCPYFIDTPLLHCVDYFRSIPKLGLEYGSNAILDAILLEKRNCYVPSGVGLLNLFKAVIPSTTIDRAMLSATSAISKQENKEKPSDK